MLGGEGRVLGEGFVIRVVLGLGDGAGGGEEGVTILWNTSSVQHFLEPPNTSPYYVQVVLFPTTAFRL